MNAHIPTTKKEAGPAQKRRVRLHLSGVVQGVGMRPFIYGLATDLGLSGHVLNGADGVWLEVEGEGVETFLARFKAELPPLARLDALELIELGPMGDSGFEIRQSVSGPVATCIGADAATCPECLHELFDPSSRFYRYPFINCTHCGPRYTITRHLPYDRAETSMAKFALCPACRADYTDPLNRRFHAEPVACPACGPKLSHPVELIAAEIASGHIVALKGIGGFHLICNARNEDAVNLLRVRKHRDAKPFAVMVETAAAVCQIAEPDEAELALVASTPRPIVLMKARPGVLASGISPRLARVGVVLAYAPVHHLLFDALKTHGIDAIVATSANPGGEPLVIDDADAHRRLAGLADLIVTHDRDIVIRADDSVAQVLNGAPAFLRRARGYVPDPIALAAEGPDVLAFGAHLKATVTVTRGREAFVSQHVGDLETAETVTFYRETIAHLMSILEVRPERLVCDLHPNYRSTQIAEEMAEELGVPLVRVQHHAAHIAAVAGEHQRVGSVLGLALDGHGAGPNGENWGGELMLVEGAVWRRLGALAPLPLPGIDLAAREPVRMAAGALSVLGRAQEIVHRFASYPWSRPMAAHLSRPGLFPVTSSMGRLFDAASGLLGLCARQAHEGQAAMELEALVTAPVALPHGFLLERGTLDFRPLLASLADESDAVRGANLFHGTLIAGLAAWVTAAARGYPGLAVALSGGCIANRILTEGLVEALHQNGLETLLPKALPPGDGGLSFGQALMGRS